MFGAPRQSEGATREAIAFDEVVDLLGVTPLLDRSPRNLSGGERQRVAIGRALMSQPKLLLMDEPLSALDRETKNEILPFLERLRDRLSLPIVYITHDLAEVERLADQIVLMENGRVLAAGPLAELQSDPLLPLAMARDAAVSLVGVIEAHEPRYGLLTLSVRGSRFIVPAPPATIGERRRIRVIADDVSLAREPPGPSSILNVLPARVVSMKPVDTNEIVAVVALGAEGDGARLFSRVTRKSWEQLGLVEGVNVHAQVKAVALAPGQGD
jgi:molybdate transport system ATP-binding protein